MAEGEARREPSRPKIPGQGQPAQGPSAPAPDPAGPASTGSSGSSGSSDSPVDLDAMLKEVTAAYDHEVATKGEADIGTPLMDRLRAEGFALLGEVPVVRRLSRPQAVGIGAGAVLAAGLALALFWPEPEPPARSTVTAETAAALRQIQPGAGTGGWLVPPGGGHRPGSAEPDGGAAGASPAGAEGFRMPPPEQRRDSRLSEEEVAAEAGQVALGQALQTVKTTAEGRALLGNSTPPAATPPEAVYQSVGGTGLPIGGPLAAGAGGYAGVAAATAQMMSKLVPEDGQMPGLRGDMVTVDPKQLEVAIVKGMSTLPKVFEDHQRHLQFMAGLEAANAAAGPPRSRPKPVVAPPKTASPTPDMLKTPLARP